MIDDMDHGVLEHELRRRGLVEAVPGVGPVMDILDPQYRVRIPQLLRLERFAENLDQRRVIGIVIGIAAPVGHRAVQLDLAVRAEMQNLSQPRIIGVGRAVHVAPGRGAHVAPLARQPGPAALGRRDHAVESAERVEHAVIAIEFSHFAILGDVKRNRPLVAGAVDDGDGHGLAAVGKRRGCVRKPGMVVMVRHADQRHRLGEAELPAENSRRAPHLVHATAVDGRRAIKREKFEAAGRFLECRSDHGRDQNRVVPRRDESRDIADVSSDLTQRSDHGVDRRPRIFGGVLVAGKALLFVVDDDAGAGLLRNLDQRNPGVVHARGGEASDVDGFAALQSLADRRDFLSRERAVDPMEADARHRRLAEPARKAIARPGEAGMPRPDPHCWCFQTCDLEGMKG